MLRGAHKGFGECSSPSRSESAIAPGRRTTPATVYKCALSEFWDRAQLYTTFEVVRCVLPEAPCREQMISTDFQSVPIITGEATLPLRWLPPATP